MSKKLMVLTNSTYKAKSGGGTISGINEINLLDVGALTVFSDENTVVAYPNPSLADKKGVMFAVGQDATKNQIGSKLSEIIPRWGRVNVEKKVYSAPVKEVQSIGAETVAGSSPVGVISIPSTLVEGSTCYIKILDITRPFLPAQRSMNIDYKVVAGETNNSLLTALVAKANALSGKFVTLSVVDTSKGILVTADDFGTKFSIAIGGIIQNSTIVTAQKYPDATVVKGMDSGYGSSDQIAALEAAFSPYEGNTNKVYMAQQWFTQQSSVVSGATYTTYSITWNAERYASFGAQSTMKKELVLAVPSGASTLIATIDDILAEAFGKGTPTIEVGS